ncbi:globin-like protein [Thozetella sp. PMI_491]|nr:globin-like protein [Thozetella sp. PMI_491]
MAAQLTPEQIAIVKATAPVLKEHGTTITQIFYDNMIGENPELRDIFNRTSHVTGRQPRALAGAVLAYATYIDDLPKLAAAVDRIAHKHVSLGITPAQYDIVGRYLMAAIGQVLGDAATPAIVDAWTTAYAVLAGVFIGLEATMYKANAAENWVGWRKFRILRKVAESDSITSFYLAPSDAAKLPGFLPGQYISLQVFVPGYGHLQSRQYSLSQAPRAEGDYYRISVKKEPAADADNLPGVISNMLHDQYKEGDEVEISHPQGEFFVDPKDVSKEGVPAVLISAGVGATPLMSILGSLAPEDKTAPVRRPVTWIHASHSSTSQPFGDEVRRITTANDHVSAHVFLKTLSPQDKAGVDYEHGETRMDFEKLDGEKDLSLDVKAAEYFVCGPESFMIDVRKALTARGVDEERIHMELFATGNLGDN